MRRPGAVRFYAAFRATHGARRLGDVQLVPITHDESFALTRRQACQLLLNDFKHLSLLQARARRLGGVVAARGLVGVERVLLLVLAAARRERGEQRGPQRAHLLAAVIVADRVLHDAVEEQRQLGRGTIAVLLREPQHRVLHDVECGFVLAHREHRLLECAPLDALQKRRKLATRCQMTLCRGGVVRAMLPSWFLRFFRPLWTESRPALYPAPRSSFAACRKRRSSTFSAIPGVRCSSSTTSSSSRTR